MAEDNEKKTEAVDIDAHLKRVFQPTIEEDVPDRFHDLLNQLREKEIAKGKTPDAEG